MVAAEFWGRGHMTNHPSPFLPGFGKAVIIFVCMNFTLAIEVSN